MKNLLRNMWNDQDGQDMIEYVLIGGLISIIAIALVTSSGTGVSTLWSKLSSSISGAAAA